MFWGQLGKQVLTLPLPEGEGPVKDSRKHSVLRFARDPTVSCHHGRPQECKLPLTDTQS